MAIRVLEPEVASKIAAGEVVERPASVVKELIENSLDAGATQIGIEVRGGGVSLIRVSDNGQGIPPGDVDLAFERYATSKISQISDLEGIATLGFRGEALPSIAAVAEVNLVTRAPEELAGVSITMKHGDIIERAKRGFPQGTTVTVRYLFHNVPARLKFLKSPVTESSHISHLVSQYSLAFPEVKFALSLDGRAIFRSSGNGELRDVLVEVFGLEVAEAMLEVKAGKETPQVSGFISPPALTRSHRSYLSFFVNRRWVQSRMLSYAVEEAYQGLIMAGRHPIAVLNILLPPEEVDVNVHPAKAEIKFRHDRAVFAALQKAVRTTLIDFMPVPTLRAVPGTVSPTVPEESPLFEDREKAPLQPPLSPPKAAPLQPPLPILRILGQLANTYVIAEGPDGMYLIDQHTAHERILFERIKAQRERQAVEVQGLLHPLTIELTPRQEELLKAQGEALSQYGFDLEPFGERTYLLRSAPALLKSQGLKEALAEILDSLGREEKAPDWQERIAVSLACHGAVRAGQALSQEEMRELVEQLEKTSLPRTCPHGRPTLLHLSSLQLERGFGR